MTMKLVRWSLSVLPCSAGAVGIWWSPSALPALVLGPGTTEVGSTGLDPPRLAPLSLPNIFLKKIENSLKGKFN